MRDEETESGLKPVDAVSSEQPVASIVDSSNTAQLDFKQNLTKPDSSDEPSSSISVEVLSKAGLSMPFPENESSATPLNVPVIGDVSPKLSTGPKAAGNSRKSARSIDGLKSARKSQITYDEYLLATKEFSEGIVTPDRIALSKFISELFTKLYAHFMRIFGIKFLQSSKVKLYTIGTLAAIFIVVIITSINGNLKSNSDVRGVSTTQDISLDKTVIEPPFQVAQPSEDKPVSFDPSVSVASFTDSIDGINIFVTQQPLTTKQLNSKDSELEKIAALLGAEGSIDSDHGKVFIAEPSTQNQDGQSVIFIVNQLLVTIRTDGQLISLSSWLNYVNNLTP